MRRVGVFILSLTLLSVVRSKGERGVKGDKGDPGIVDDKTVQRKVDKMWSKTGDLKVQKIHKAINKLENFSPKRITKQVARAEKDSKKAQTSAEKAKDLSSRALRKAREAEKAAGNAQKSASMARKTAGNAQESAVKARKSAREAKAEGEAEQVKESILSTKQSVEKLKETADVKIKELKESTDTQVTEIKRKLDEQKEKTNDLSIKNSRLWAKEQIRLAHDKMMVERKSKDNDNESEQCEKELTESTIIFPAIEISSEIEDKEDTTCIDTNRDELLKSFCSFRMDLDSLFQIQGVKTPAKSFWPNICCKERNDDDRSKTLETCEPPEGSNIEPENMIPFALSQGGHYNRHNLYVEVTEAIKKGGYLHKGMKDLVASLSSSVDTRNATDRVDAFFEEVSLCGPRIVNAPGNNERKLCELFVPYHHAMKSFYTLIESLFLTPITIQSSFLETMERSLRKRSEPTRFGKNNLQPMLQMKTKTVNATCTGGSKWTSAELEQKKRGFCLGYNHLDLSDTNIKNVAVHYLKHDISYDDKKMFELSKQLRYQVTDYSCPAPLFTANDISIQQVAMDTLGKKKEWVAVVNLNTLDKNGYLQSELPFCEDRKYLIGSKVEVKAYVDESNCCKHVKGYKECEELCGKKLKELIDKGNKHYSKDVVVTGTQYRLENSHVSRRRRLFQEHQGGC
eukprot:g8981.t1